MLRKLGHLLASPQSVAVGAVVLGVVSLRFAFFGGGGDHVVTVDFSDVNGLVVGNEVRIAGITAGNVQSVDIVHTGQTGASTPSQYAQVHLAIDGSHWPLHQGTSFAVRPKGVLSNVYVSLTPGSTSAPALDATQAIPVAQTQSPVNLDEVTNIFDPAVRDALRTQINQGAVMLGGEGSQNGASNLNGLIANLNPLTNDLTPLTAVLAERTPELGRLNTEFATILGELASENGHLAGVISNGDTLFAAIASKQQDLQGTIDHAASVLTQLDQVLTGEEANLGAIFQKGPAALDRATQAFTLLNPLVTAVNPHIPSLDILLHDFLTASGYTINGQRALRIDGSLGSAPTSACGGEPSQQPQCATPATRASTDGSSVPATQATDSAAPLLLGGLLG